MHMQRNAGKRWKSTCRLSLSHNHHASQQLSSRMRSGQIVKCSVRVSHYCALVCRQWKMWGARCDWIPIKNLPNHFATVKSSKSSLSEVVCGSKGTPKSPKKSVKLRRRAQDKVAAVPGREPLEELVQEAQDMHTVTEMGTSVPAFLGKLWRLVEDPETDDLICWSPVCWIHYVSTTFFSTPNLNLTADSDFAAFFFVREDNHTDG